MRWERGRWSTVGVLEAVAERCVSASAERALHEEANRSVRVLQKNDSSGSSLGGDGTVGGPALRRRRGVHDEPARRCRERGWSGL